MGLYKDIILTMKKKINPILGLISAAKDTALSNINHKIWTMRQAQKNRASFLDSLNSEDSVVMEAEPYVSPKREMTPIERAVQAFLTSSRLDGYVEPFLELELIQSSLEPEKIARMFNQALCIIRYLCKGDTGFCEGALSMMLDELKECAENDKISEFTVMRALCMGACAMDAVVFNDHFVHQPHERWKHAYIIEVNTDIGFDDFMGMVQSMFVTLNYTCPDFSHLIKNEDHLFDWVEDINVILEPMGLKLFQLENDILKNCLFVLLKSFECNVLNGMMAEIEG